MDTEDDRRVVESSEGDDRRVVQEMSSTAEESKPEAMDQ